MAKRNIGMEILEGLEEIKAWRLGKRTLKTTTVELPQAAEVPKIRRELGLSQQQFASMMGVSVATLRNWEQGRRQPQGPARALLLVAAMEPAIVLKALKTGLPAGERKPPGVAQRMARYRASKRGRRL